MNKKHATIPETLISEKEIKKCQHFIVDLPSKNKTFLGDALIKLYETL
jgi:hypothetical protein